MSAFVARCTAAALLFMIVAAGAAPTPARAQAEPPQDMPPDAAPAGQFSDAEIDQMLAPIALYPDPLLAQMFMASTYPSEIGAAARWVAEHPGLSPDQVQAALADETWDPSVKSLVVVPDVLRWMASNAQWTEGLGEAFLAQGDRLMDHVQALRQRAQANGTLQSTAQEQVVNAGGQIEILPADPQYIYVPVYQPTVVYGPWWWPEYPPYELAAPAGAVFISGFFWGSPWRVGPALWGRPDWRDHRVTINTPNYNAFVRTKRAPPDWRFDPAHRRGAPYYNPNLRAQYGGVNPANPGARPPAPAAPMPARPGAPPPNGQRFERPPGNAPEPGRRGEPSDRGQPINRGGEPNRQQVVPEAPRPQMPPPRPARPIRPPPQPTAPAPQVQQQLRPPVEPQRPAPQVAAPPPAPPMHVAPQAPPRQVRPQMPAPAPPPMAAPAPVPQQMPQQMPQQRPTERPGGAPGGGEGERGGQPRGRPQPQPPQQQQQQRQQQ